MSRSTFSRALAAIAAFIASAPAPALAAETEDDIVITGRFATQQTASSVSVITRSDIERRQLSTVFEALRSVPGVQLTKNGGLGQATKVRLRGANGNQVLTLIDGVPVNDPTAAVVGGGFDFAYLDAGAVEQIEILRGAGSAIWGSDAIGGVINVVTTKPGDNGVSAYAEGGSFTTGRLGARGALSTGPLTLSGFATVYKTGGISAAEEHAGNPEEDGARATTTGLRALLQLGGGVYAQTGFRLTEGRSEFDNGFPIADADYMSKTQDAQGDARLGWRTAAKASGIEAMALRSLTRRYYSDFDSSYRGQRAQYRLTGDTRFAGAHKALVGFEHEELDVAAGKSDSDALFGAYNGRLFKRLLLEGGLRYEDDSRYGASTTGRVAAAFDVWTGGSLRAAYGTGFRAPSIDEVFGNPAFGIGPNNNLRPEESDEWEIGLDQTLWSGALKLGIVYFNREIANQIAYNGLPNPALYDNLARVETEGTEVSAKLLRGRWTLEGAYAHIESIDQASGLQLQRVPQDTASLDIDFQATGKWSVGAYVTYNGEERDFPTNPGWTTLDLRTAFTLSPNTQIYGRIENATDEDYQDAPGYGAPDRAYYAGVRVKM